MQCGLISVPIQQQVIVANVSLSSGRVFRRRLPVVRIYCIAETLNIESSNLAFESRLLYNMGD
jgi:hypothetical protein